MPNPDVQEGEAKKLMWKWYREHCFLEYIMDNTQKTEKISAPNGKHDDYCDSSVLGLHGALAMLPGEASFSSLNIEKTRNRRFEGTPTSTFATSKTGMSRSHFKKRTPRGF